MNGLWLSIDWEWNNHPNWRTHIVQRGGSTTNQTWLVIWNMTFAICGTQPPWTCELLQTGAPHYHDGWLIIMSFPVHRFNISWWNLGSLVISTLSNHSTSAYHRSERLNELYIYSNTVNKQSNRRLIDMGKSSSLIDMMIIIYIYIWLVVWNIWISFP